MTAPADEVGHQLSAVLTNHRVLDLTLPLAEELPCTWPGHMPVRATTWTWFADRPGNPQPVQARTGGSYQTRWLVIDEHTGTHIDAPRHFIPPPGTHLPHAGPGGEIGVDKLPLLAAAGPACVIDATGLAAAAGPGTSPPVTAAELTAWQAAHGDIQPGDVVLRTGWDSRYQAGPAGAGYGADALVARTGPAWPAPTPEAIGWLCERGVQCAGTDGLSIGPADDGAPAHLAGLTRGMVFVEALSRLDEVPPRGAWFLFLPLRLVEGTGAPGQALAVLPTPTGDTAAR